MSLRPEALDSRPPFPRTETVRLSEIEYVFKAWHDTPDVTMVSQGCEGISHSDWLLSDGFGECSARLLVNAQDGSALLKHVGPQGAEGFMGGGTIGKNPQAE